MDRSRQTHEPPTQALPPKPRPSFRYQPRRYSKAREGTPKHKPQLRLQREQTAFAVKEKEGNKVPFVGTQQEPCVQPGSAPLPNLGNPTGTLGNRTERPCTEAGESGRLPCPPPPSTARGVQPISLKNRNRESCGSARGGIAVDRSGENLASCRGRVGWKPTAFALVPRAALLMSTHSSPLSSPTGRGSKGLPAGELGVFPQGSSHTQRNVGFTGGADHGAARGRLGSGVPPGKFP